MVLINFIFNPYLHNVSDCFDKQPLGKKCALITNTISLFPTQTEIPLTLKYKQATRVKVVTALEAAIQEGGLIYNSLNPPISS